MDILLIWWSVQERRRLAELAQTELGLDSYTPETNVATLVQRILKSGVLAHKSVEYRCVVTSVTRAHTFFVVGR